LLPLRRPVQQRLPHPMTVASAVPEPCWTGPVGMTYGYKWKRLLHTETPNAGPPAKMSFMYRRANSHSATPKSSHGKECSMERKLHLLESFTAQGSDGRAYKVYGYEHLVRDDSVAAPVDNWEPTGELEYRLADGERVDAHRDGSMRIARSGVRLSISHDREQSAANRNAP
jgi:hypothetical protein